MAAENFLQALRQAMSPKAHDAIDNAISSNNRMKFQGGGIVEKMMSLFKKDDEDSSVNYSLPGRMSLRSDEEKVEAALERLTDISATEYGPESIFPADIGNLANILYNIEGGQKPGRYKFSGGKGEVINPSDPQKLIGMVADVFTEPDPYYDKYGRPSLTGKSSGTTDVQDIVELISQGEVEDSAVLDTILQQIQ
jgi:hypothetical protein